MILRRQPDAGPEDVLDARALPEECVDHGSARRREWRLEEVGEDRHDGMECFPWRLERRSSVRESSVRGSFAVRILPPPVLDPPYQLGEDREVEEEGRREERVLLEPEDSGDTWEEWGCDVL